LAEAVAAPLWPSDAELQSMGAAAGVAAPYRVAVLRDADVDRIAALIATWYPALHVGMESGHIDPAFYRAQVHLADRPGRRGLFAWTIWSGDDPCGLCSFEYEPGSGQLAGRLLVLAPEHRGQGLATTMTHLVDALARHLGAEIILATATLAHPFSQRVLEAAGYRVVGIIPGYDRDLVGPSRALRVHEALYAKLLVDPVRCAEPDRGAMSPAVSRLFDVLFGDPPPGR
jgi:RimJ/RimL family protein N-acetyltransferase